jgi:hypothetical protein
MHPIPGYPAVPVFAQVDPITTEQREAVASAAKRPWFPVRSQPCGMINPA